MTAKEKANSIFMSFSPELLIGLGMNDETFETNRKFALIVIDEILNEFSQGFNGSFEERRKKYWQEVKQETEKL